MGNDPSKTTCHRAIIKNARCPPSFLETSHSRLLAAPHSHSEVALFYGARVSSGHNNDWERHVGREQAPKASGQILSWPFHASKFCFLYQKTSACK